MRKLRLASLALLVLFATPSLSEGQQSRAIPRLCFLVLEPGPLQTRSARYDPFFRTLRELSYVDGQSIIVDFLSADDHDERFPALVAECLRREADVIVPTTTPAAEAAKKATSTVPIVMLLLGDPVGTGLVDSLARPGGNVTGTSLMVTELAAKRLELLKDAVPAISGVLVLAYLVDPIGRLQVAAMREASRSLGISLQVHDIGNGDDIPAAFDAAVGEGANGLTVTAASLFVTYQARVVELAARHRLPAMYPFARTVRESGGLMAYAANGPDLQRRSASYVDRILKGAKPSDLPVEQPAKFELLINLKTAEALGLKFPPNFLALADQVIE